MREVGKICECGFACVLINEIFPWTPQHWQCPECDSTYCIEEDSFFNSGPLEEAQREIVVEMAGWDKERTEK